ncbi:hypothetical protein MRX96_055261 [Rhipicephalus microplus]
MKNFGRLNMWRAGNDDVRPGASTPGDPFSTSRPAQNDAADARKQKLLGFVYAVPGPVNPRRRDVPSRAAGGTGRSCSARRGQRQPGRGHLRRV